MSYKGNRKDKRQRTNFSLIVKLSLVSFLIIFTIGIINYISITSSSIKQVEDESIIFGGINARIIIFTEFEDKAKEAIKRSFNFYNQLEKTISNYDKESELYAFNKNITDKPIRVSKTFYDIVTTSVNYSKLIENLTESKRSSFDITVYPLIKLWKQVSRKIKEGNGDSSSVIPSKELIERVKKLVSYRYLVIDEEESSLRKDISDVQLDFGAIGKGYAVDGAVAILTEAGFKDFLVQIGGDIHINGIQPADKEKKGWHVSIRNPFYQSEALKDNVEYKTDKPYFHDFYSTSLSISSSGHYERGFTYDGKRYSHIIDPTTGYPVNPEIASVTVIANDNTTADVLATAFSILGPEKSKKIVDALENVSFYMIVDFKTRPEVIKYGPFKF